MDRQGQFHRPPMTMNAAGEERTIGVEIEFGGLSAKTSAEVVKSLFDGTVIRHNQNAFQVTGTKIGDFAVKLDMRFSGYKNKDRGLLDELKVELANLFGAAASLVVPVEVVAPPVAINQLPDIDKLIVKLRSRGACGTHASLLFAFGLHLNPETPRVDARTIAAIMKAYGLASPWLWHVVDPDPTRRLLSFAEPYPDAYLRRLAEEDYWPNIPILMDDYIELNPTRNRDLDMLPLFAFLDEDRVRRRLPHEKINPRPTFHYRLPDMALDDKTWGLATEWNRWVAVERLAADETRLAEICRAYLEHRGSRQEWRGRKLFEVA